MYSAGYIYFNRNSDAPCNFRMQFFTESSDIYDSLADMNICNAHIHTCTYVLTVLSYILLCVIISCIYVCYFVKSVPFCTYSWHTTHIIHVKYAFARIYSWECSSSFNNNLFSCLLYVSCAE